MSSGGRKLPVVERWGGIRAIQRKIKRATVIDENREGIAEELLLLAQSKVTDVVAWDGQAVTVKDLASLPDAVQRTIKKLKVTPTAHGPMVEVELHDKVAALRLVAKAAGLLETERQSHVPSVIGIEITPPRSGDVSVPAVSAVVSARPGVPALVEPMPEEDDGDDGGDDG